MPPFISGVARFALAGLLMYAWLRLRNPRPFAGVNIPMMALTGVLLSGMGNGFVLWAQQGIPSGIAALIVAVRAGARVDLRLGVLQQARADEAGAVRYRRGDRRRGDDRDAHAHRSPATRSRCTCSPCSSATTGWSIGTLVQKRSANPATVLSFTCGQMLFGAAFQLLMSLVDRRVGALRSRGDLTVRP